MAVPLLNPALPAAAPTPVRPPIAVDEGRARGGSFADALVRALDAVDGDIKAADTEVNKVVRGDSVELHDVMMSLEKADVSVRLMTQVGRRAVDAYREIMRMNV